MKLYSKLLIVLTLFTSTSCSDFLDFNNESNIQLDDFNKDENELYASLIGCYNGTSKTIHREWALTELRADNSRLFNKTSTASPSIDIRDLDYGVTQSNNIFVEEYWDATYKNITNCNIVIRDIDVVEIEELHNRYLAEATFIRAYHYFNLVRLYGGVPLVLKKLSIEEANNMQRNSADEVYDQIEKDLVTIVDGNMLPNKLASPELGRISMLAAKSMLAKVYMTRYNIGTDGYNKAEALLLDVITTISPEGNLLPYKDVFDIAKEMNDEIIFAIRFKAGNIGLGSLFGNEFAPRSSGTNVVNGDGSSFNYPTKSMVAAYEAGDLRKDLSLSESYNIKTVDKDGKEVITIKYENYVTKYIVSGQAANDSEADWPVIRLADVMLLYAEILNEKGESTTKAAEYVDKVRVRSGLPVLADDVRTVSYKLRDAIRDERRVELGFENQRWFDLARWGIAIETVNESFLNDTEEFYEDIAPIDDNKVLLPIPYTVLNINPSMSQNVGY